MAFSFTNTFINGTVADASKVQANLDKIANELNNFPTDAVIKAGGITAAHLASTAAVKLTGDQTVGGTKTFSANVRCSVSAPSNIADLTRKDYVDGQVAAVVTPATATINTRSVKVGPLYFKQGSKAIPAGGVVTIDLSADGGGDFPTACLFATAIPSQFEGDDNGTALTSKAADEIKFSSKDQGTLYWFAVGI